MFNNADFPFVVTAQLLLDWPRPLFSQPAMLKCSLATSCVCECGHRHHEPHSRLVPINKAITYGNTIIQYILLVFILSCLAECRHSYLFSLSIWSINISIAADNQHAVREAATICPRPLQVDLWPFDPESGVTCDVGYLCANFSLPRPLCSRLRPDVRDRQTDVIRQASSLNRRGHNNAHC